MKRLTLVNDISVSATRPAGLPGVHAPFLFCLPIYKRELVIIAIAVLYGIGGYAQTTSEQQQEAYKKTIADRSAKIVNTLGITDSSEYKRTQEEIANQYFNLNNIQEQNKSAQDGIKAQSLSKEEMTDALHKLDEKKSSDLLHLHEKFITDIKAHLTESQVEQVKDGMTYRIFPITYSAYQDMIPELTNEQKTQIYSWLKEAREQAMDAESSEKKHAVFGKYKGKINNYLSAAGYDMKKEGEDWQKRIKEREQKKAQ